MIITTRRNRILDRPTQLLLEEQRAFAAKGTLTTADQSNLDEINNELERLGFRFFHPDDEYSRYLRKRNTILEEKFQSEQPATIAKKAVELSRQEREELATRLIDDMLADEQELDEAIET